MGRVPPVVDSARPGHRGIPVGTDTERQHGVLRVIVVQRQPELMQVIRAGHAADRFARGHDGGGEQCQQHTNHSQRREQLDQRKGSAAPPAGSVAKESVRNNVAVHGLEFVWADFEV